MEPKSVIGIYIYICIIFLPGVRRENVSSLSLKIKKKKKKESTQVKCIQLV